MLYQLVISFVSQSVQIKPMWKFDLYVVMETTEYSSICRTNL